MSKRNFGEWLNKVNQDIAKRKTFSEWIRDLQIQKHYIDTEFWSWNPPSQVKITPPKGEIFYVPPPHTNIGY